MRYSYLLCDPATCLVVRRAHDQGLHPNEQHLLALAVPAHVWKTYRAGDLLSAGDLFEPELTWWIEATARARREERGRRAYLRRLDADT